MGKIQNLPHLFDFLALNWRKKLKIRPFTCNVIYGHGIFLHKPWKSQFHMHLFFHNSVENLNTFFIHFYEQFVPQQFFIASLVTNYSIFSVCSAICCVWDMFVKSKDKYVLLNKMFHSVIDVRSFFEGFYEWGFAVVCGAKGIDRSDCHFAHKVIWIIWVCLLTFLEFLN